MKFDAIMVGTGLTFYKLEINKDIIYLLNSTVDDTLKNIYIVNSNDGQFFSEYNNDLNTLKKYSLKPRKKVNLHIFSRKQKIKSLYD